MTDQKDKPRKNTEEPATEEVLDSTELADEEGAASDDTPQDGPGVDSSETSAAPVEPAAKSTAGSGSRGWFTALLLLLLLAAVAALAYVGWERERGLQAGMERLNTALSEQQSALSSVQRQAQSAATQAQSSSQQNRQQLEQLQDQLQSRLNEQRRNLETQLQTLHQQVRSLSTTTTEDWKLAEAYYLMRLAAQRLLMERDTSSALALLEGADDIVRNYPDADLHAVRSALADDMATLRLADNVDYQGIYLRIAALGRNAQSLPISERPTFRAGAEQEGADQDLADQEKIAHESTEAAATPSDVEPDSDSTTLWSRVRRSFHAMVDKLQDYIRISHDQDQLESLMMAPAAADQLLSSLLLNLDTAQLALLREQPEIYRHSLERALQLTLQFVPSSQQRQRFVAELEALRDTNVVQDLPSIGASQQAMAVYLERRHRLNSRDNGSANGNGQESGSSQP